MYLEYRNFAASLYLRASTTYQSAWFTHKEEGKVISFEVRSGTHTYVHSNLPRSTMLSTGFLVKPCDVAQGLKLEPTPRNNWPWHRRDQMQENSYPFRIISTLDERRRRKYKHLTEGRLDSGRLAWSMRARPKREIWRRWQKIHSAVWAIFSVFQQN